ncbi:MAG: hypothetical protein AAB331_02270, partial [Planctomycetota bacterium]
RELGREKCWCLVIVVLYAKPYTLSIPDFRLVSVSKWQNILTTSDLSSLPGNLRKDPGIKTRERIIFCG